MAECKIDISKLPEDVREKLAELDLELSEELANVGATNFSDTSRLAHYSTCTNSQCLLTFRRTCYIAFYVDGCPEDMSKMIVERK
ncbi:hypothetical protein V9T40_001978 [Parthenolecanium corni]|uniref:Uncharacterized protein n=1 Tax=Parthenolecanium corni TaxID=536013 RepID=A0AAN9TI33_9HEMI